MKSYKNRLKKTAVKKDHAPVRRLSGSREAPRRNETWGASEGNIVLWLVFEPKVDFSDNGLHTRLLTEHFDLPGVLKTLASFACWKNSTSQVSAVVVDVRLVDQLGSGHPLVFFLLGKTRG